MLSGLINEWALQRNCQLAAEEARTVAVRLSWCACSVSTCLRCRLSATRRFFAVPAACRLCLCRIVPPRVSKDVRLTAIAGGGTIDPFSEETRLIESVLQETQLRSAGGVWPFVIRKIAMRRCRISSFRKAGTTARFFQRRSRKQAGTGSIILTFRDAAAAQYAVSA